MPQCHWLCLQIEKGRTRRISVRNCALARSLSHCFFHPSNWNPHSHEWYLRLMYEHLAYFFCTLGILFFFTFLIFPCRCVSQWLIKTNPLIGFYYLEMKSQWLDCPLTLGSRQTTPKMVCHLVPTFIIPSHFIILFSCNELTGKKNYLCNYWSVKFQWNKLVGFCMLRKVGRKWEIGDWLSRLGISGTLVLEATFRSPNSSL